MKKNTSTLLVTFVAIALMFSASSAFAAGTKTHPAGKGTKPTTSHTKTSKTPRLGLGGTVTAVTGTTITIESGPKKSPVSVTIDASKAKIRGTTAKTLADIKVGDVVAIVGKTENSVVTATAIIVRPGSLVPPKAFTSAKIKGMNSLAPKTN